MQDQLNRAIVRIFDQNDLIQGAGCLVADKRIITCAHVVQSALDISDEDTNISKLKVKLDLPHISPNSYFFASIELWYPEEDIAGLKVEGNMPNNANPVELIVSHNLWGHTFAAFGFPASIPAGVWASGIIRGSQSQGWLQVEDTKQTGYQIVAGFSGAPVWDEELAGVVGIIVATDTKDETKAAYMIPSEKLYNNWTDVVTRSLLPEDEYIGRILTLSKEEKSSIVDRYVDLPLSVETKPKQLNTTSDDILRWKEEARSSSIDRGEKNSEESVSPVARTVYVESLDDALELHPQIVLLGAPGAGKSTTLRRLIWNLAKMKQNSSKGPIPLLLNLSDWQNKVSPDPKNKIEEPLSVEEWIVKKWPLETDPQPLLKSGEVLLCLDGLNEMGEGTEKRIKLLRTWIHGPTGAKNIVVSCRKDDYLDNVSLKLDLPIVTVEKMDEATIRKFTENHLQDKAPLFLKKIFSKQETARNAQNPYFLECMVNFFNESGTLPENTGFLLQQLAEIRWLRERMRKSSLMPVEAMRTKFADLAFEIIDKEQPLNVPYEWIMAKIIGKPKWIQKKNEREEAADFVQGGRNSLVLEKEGDTIKFSHQLLQENFAALKLQNNLRKTLDVPTFTTMIRQAGKWDQVVFAIVNITSDVDNVILDVSRKDPILAYECIKLAKPDRIKNKTANNVVSNTIDMFKKFNSYIILQVIVDLCSWFPQVRKTAIAPLLKEAKSGKIDFKQEDALWVLSHIGDERILSDLRKIVMNSNLFAKELSKVRKEIDSITDGKISNRALHGAVDFISGGIKAAGPTIINLGAEYLEAKGKGKPINYKELAIRGVMRRKDSQARKMEKEGREEMFSGKSKVERLNELMARENYLLARRESILKFAGQAVRQIKMRV